MIKVAPNRERATKPNPDATSSSMPLLTRCRSYASRSDPLGMIGVTRRNAQITVAPSRE
jgi:hypothetical protein